MQTPVVANACQLLAIREKGDLFPLRDYLQLVGGLAFLDRGRVRPRYQDCILRLALGPLDELELPCGSYPKDVEPRGVGLSSECHAKRPYLSHRFHLGFDDQVLEAICGSRRNTSRPHVYQVVLAILTIELPEGIGCLFAPGLRRVFEILVDHQITRGTGHGSNGWRTRRWECRCDCGKWRGCRRHRCWCERWRHCGLTTD